MFVIFLDFGHSFFVSRKKPSVSPKKFLVSQSKHHLRGTIPKKKTFCTPLQ